MKTFWIWILLSFSHFLLRAEDEHFDPFASSLTNTQNLLPTTIRSISAISGEWLESETDFIVKGAEPLVLTRTYCADYSIGKLGYNWDFNRPQPLTIQGKKHTYKTRLHLPSGGKAVYENNKADYEHHTIDLNLSNTTALTNCRSSEISGRTNLHNLRLRIDSDKQICEVVTGSGHVTRYFKEKNHTFSPEYERKTNGNLLLFDEDCIRSSNPDQSIHYGNIVFKSQSREELIVKASDGKVATYSFNCYQSQEPPFYLGPEDSSVRKEKPVRAMRYCLVKANYSHKPQIEYEYDHPPHENPLQPPPNPRLKAKKWPNGRLQEVTYYQDGENDVSGFGKIKISKSNDFRLHRIKEIRAPVEQNKKEPVVTHSFVYLADDPASANKGKSFSGLTEVYDAYQRKTSYAYNKEHRPQSISHFTEGNVLYSKERFLWDEGEEHKKIQNLIHNAFQENSLLSFNFELQDIQQDPVEMITAGISHSSHDLNSAVRKSQIPHKDILNKLRKPIKSPKWSSQVGNLLGKYVEDGNGTIQHALLFLYDSRGNIKKERFYGNLTGTNIVTAINNLDDLSKVDHYEKRYSYSDDSFNHLLYEIEGNGKCIEYVYDDDTQQVTAKYIKDGTSICLRQFFLYDKDTAALTKVIKDDGSSRDINDLKDVKVRQITCITICKDNPKETDPAKKEPIGLPKNIEEKYWNGFKEMPLKKIECHYKNGNLTQQDHYDALGIFRYSLYWEYDPHGNLLKETNAEGHVINKRYDLNDNLIEELGPSGSKFYSYDYANRLVCIEHVIDGQSFVTEYSYDLLGNRTVSRDSFKNETRYTYDEFNRLIKTEYPAIQSTTGTIIPTSESRYDVNHNPISITQPGGWITEFTYNSRGKPLTKKHPDGRTEKFEYFPDGTLAKCIDPNGNETTYRRDYLGRILEEKTFDGQQDIIQTYSYKGALIVSKKDGEGNLTEFTYDGAGRISSETFGNSHKTYSYDSLGRVERIIQSYGESSQEVSVQAFAYDLLNQVTEERLEDARGAIIQRYCYKYDQLGNKINTTIYTDTGKSETEIEYNGNSQPLLITDAQGNQTHYSYKYDYKNALGQFVLQVAITDPKGRTILQTYDAAGKIYEVSRTESFNQKIVAKQQTLYDPLGRISQTIDFVFENGTYKRDYVNKWSYYFNEKVERFEEGVGSEKPKCTRWIYLDFGKKEELIKPNGVKITHIYDPVGRLQEVFSEDGTVHYAYSYDRCNRLNQVEDKINHIFTTREFDSKGLLKKEILANGLVFHYDYDRLGRIKDFTLPDSSAIHYLYDSVYLKQIQRIKNNTLIYQHENVQYDLSGTLKKAILIGQAGWLSKTYDKLGRVQEIQHSQWSQHIPAEGYDSTGCLIASTTQDAAGTTQHAYAYNQLDHLHAEQGHLAHTYITDSLQNRLKKNDMLCTVNALNQLNSQGDCRYTYNDNGNLIEKQTTNVKTQYRYDALDRLISVTSQNGSITTFQYDSFNRRLSKNHQGIATKYLYQGQNEIGSMNEIGEITELRVLTSSSDSEIGSAVALELYGKTYAPIHDRQGHVVCLLDSLSGKPAETYRYTAFGEETIYNAQGHKLDHSQTKNPWRFASKRVDPETDWIYFGRRYYDPETGRWTTPDPIGFSDGPNLYAYLHHHPLNGFDAYGLLGEAYRDFCKPEFSRPYFENRYDNDYSPIFSLGHDRSSANEGREGYIGSMNSPMQQAIGGIFHGGVDFVTHQICGNACFLCSIGCHEWDDPEERMCAQAAFSQWQMNHLNSLDTWIIESLALDPNNPIYQNCRSCTKTGLDVGTLLVGGYGLVKGGIEVVRLSRVPLAGQGAEFAGSLALQNSIRIRSQPIWSATKDKSSIQNAFGHWKKHGHEFYEIQNAKQYVEMAHNFFRDPAYGTLEKIRLNGEILKYHPNSNTFGVFTQNGVPKTLYKPDPLKHFYPTNLDYFYAQ